jgi:hypothetical protein
VGLEEDLGLLEKTLRELQVGWEKFFGGVERKPPYDVKTKVEMLIRKYASAELRNNTERFRYQNLTARYNTFNELWAKRLRAVEEGKPLGVHGLKADVLPPPKPAVAAAEPRSHAAAPSASEVRVRNAEADAGAVKALYERFLEERKRAGETGAVKFDSFQKLIAQQATRIIKEKGAAAVDFRFETKDGKVSLKAKPVR